jgi:hypothetical protein
MKAALAGAAFASAAPSASDLAAFAFPVFGAREALASSTSLASFASTLASPSAAATAVPLATFFASFSTGSVAGPLLQAPGPADTLWLWS